MKVNDLNQTEDKLDIFSFFFIVLKNVKTFILFLFISFILGIIFYYNLPPNFLSKDKNNATVNFLVDENPIYKSVEIVQALNTSLASAFNYEKWCTEIIKKCDNIWLEQQSASEIQALPRQHWAMIEFTSKEHLDEINSFLSFTIERVNSKILKDIHSLYQEKINSVEDQIENQILELRRIEKEALDTQIRKQTSALEAITKTQTNMINKENEMKAIFQSKLELINAEIASRSDNINVSEEELKYLESLLESSNKDSKLIISLRIIDVMNSIKKDNLQINTLEKSINLEKINLKRNIEKEKNWFKREIELLENIVAKPSLESIELEEFEPVYTSDEQDIELFLKMYPNVEIRIIQIKQTIIRMEKDLRALLNEKESTTKNVLSLGKINSSYKKTSAINHLIPILIIFLVIGTILCSIFLLLKEEYIKRKI